MTYADITVYDDCSVNCYRLQCDPSEKISTLQSENQRLNTVIDNLHSSLAAAIAREEALQSSLDKAQERERKLVEGLKEYGKHKCTTVLAHDPCTCGLSALIEGRE